MENFVIFLWRDSFSRPEGMPLSGAQVPAGSYHLKLLSQRLSRVRLDSRLLQAQLHHKVP